MTIGRGEWEPMAIDKALIDELLADYKKPEDIIGENGLLKQLTKAILERALQAELTDHLGFEKHDPAGHHSGNSRDGSDRGGSKNLAEPAAGGDVSHRVSGRHDGQDAGQRTRAEPGDLCGAGGGSRGAEGSPGTVGGAAGGGQVLAASADRAEEPW